MQRRNGSFLAIDECTLRSRAADLDLLVVFDGPNFLSRKPRRPLFDRVCSRRWTRWRTWRMWRTKRRSPFTCRSPDQSGDPSCRCEQTQRELRECCLLQKCFLDLVVFGRLRLFFWFFSFALLHPSHSIFLSPSHRHFKLVGGSLYFFVYKPQIPLSSSRQSAFLSPFPRSSLPSNSNKRTNR